MLVRLVCAYSIIASPHHYSKSQVLKSVIQHPHGTAFVAPPLTIQHRKQQLLAAAVQSSRTVSALHLSCNNHSNNMSSSADNIQNQNYNLAQNPAELFDLYPAPPSSLHHNSIVTSDWGETYFPHPLPTGKVKERGRVHIDGDWHRSIQVWMIERSGATENGDEDVTVLLQRRSQYKDTHPNQLDVSCAGHVNAGDDVLETTMRELQEELGGNGAMQQYTIYDIQQSKAFIVSSAIHGETARFGRFICREYQDVFMLEWKGDSPMKTNMFHPLVQEEVSGFVLMDGKELIERLRRGDTELVPRSREYIDGLAKMFFR